MPSPDYYRKQAQLFARLATASRAPSVSARYNAMALEYLAKAAELDADNTDIGTAPVFLGHDRRLMDRD
jgi:hypothetical protein